MRVYDDVHSLFPCVCAAGSTVVGGVLFRGVEGVVADHIISTECDRRRGRKMTLRVPDEAIDAFTNKKHWCPACIKLIEQQNGLQFAMMINGFMFDGPCSKCDRRTTILMRLDVGARFVAATARCSTCEKKEEQTKALKREVFMASVFEDTKGEHPYRKAAPVKKEIPKDDSVGGLGWWVGILMLSMLVALMFLMGGVFK